MEEDFADFEARMYAQVYHDTSIEPTPTESSDSLPHNLNKQSNKRYWQRSKNLSTHRENFDQQPEQTLYPSERQHQQPPPKIPFVPIAPKPILTDEATAKPATKTFVPYSSVLSFMESPKEPLPAKPSNYEKKKNKPAKFPKVATGKLLNPLSKQGVTKGKSAMKLEIQQKKQKAALARKKMQSKIVTTIELEDSDESDCVPVELPPPPLISLDSSDDEETIKKKRAMSPSSSSIISDDFIVAGDKRRLANPFKSDEMKNATEKLRKIVQQDTLEKVKALTKASSTSSSDSARSSVERSANGAKSPAEQKKTPEVRKNRKTLRNSLDNSNEDSIYKAKASKQAKEQANDSSGDEAPCVNAKNQKIRRRKSTGSRKKSTDCDQESEREDEGDPRTKLISSTPVAKLKKRSRIITGSYDENEFASMISTILRNDVSLEDDEVSSEAVSDPIVRDKNIISIADSTVVEEVASQDCEIIEQPLVVVTVPDDDEPVLSDSDDSMRGVKIPIDCDLSLNVTQVPYDPHEYIRDGGGESSRELTTISIDEVNPEIGWNDEMKFFYDGSWGAEHFCVSELFDSMPRDPKLWRINNADRNRTMDSGSRMRCRKCNEIGHMAVRCNRPKKRIVCFMCGEEGHRETRCPNSICLRCGKPSRLFATICTSCHKLSKKYCPLCNYQGHDIEMCPDKWRRYHSTTTDAAELNSEYQINPRVYCSICARRGHFAESCNQFLKTISGLITSSTIKIISHKPSYPRIYLNSFEAASIKRDEQQLLALFTFFPFYKFNFQFSRNVRLYPRFIEQFTMHKQRMEAARAIELTPREKKSRKRNRKKQKLQDKSPETVTSTVATSVVHDDSNSNYSFSEFYQQPKQSVEVFKSPESVNESSETSFEKAIKAVKETIAEKETTKMVKNPFAVKLPEFIPLSNDENIPRPVQIEHEPEVVGEAKMMMTNDHSKLLMNKKGQNFLSDLQSRLEVTAIFKWDGTGNSLIISGVPSNQSMFHLEVREYLFRTELAQYEKILETSTNLPKNKVRIVHVLKENLQLMNRLKTFAVKSTLDTMISAEKTMDFKKTLKCRKALNIAFVGHAELCEGAQHVGALRRILFLLEKELTQGKFEISAEMREEITMHMKPIFSHHDYGDYKKLFSQYSKIMKQRQKNKGKLLPNPILN